MTRELRVILSVFTLAVMLSDLQSTEKTEPRYSLPGVQAIGGIKILLVPDELGKETAFSFEKQDLNGFSGSDELFCTLQSPSGKTVWKATIPDDGDTRKHWKLGPKQKVKCRFVPKEAGVYTLTGKAANGADILLHFSRSEAKDCIWALSSQRLRTDRGRLHAWLLMPRLKAGEKPEQPIKLTGAKFTRLTGLTIKAEGKELIRNYTLPKYVKSDRQVNDHQIMLKRPPGIDIFELDSEDFTEVVAIEFPQYGPVMLTADKNLAQKILPYLVKPEQQR